ncbi:hypothetical protein LAZ67_3004591 [Cordylochernes scorpioides]|uniref:Uncharacterized protein n=1 Tax=Cordylochernes scorpioides TaxID=51811 RepID=A0ABY6K9N3_9ARAC|nr:hypothetical protein LAZ67_3004591 [Cordylochernes scorpioides]
MEASVDVRMELALSSIPCPKSLRLTYIDNLLECFRLQDVRSISTPMEVNVDLDDTNDGLEENLPYRELIAKKVLRYLGGTKYYGITYRPTGEQLEAFADADWASKVEDRKSITGNVIMLAGAPIIWKNVEQTVTALSTMEAEYVALSTTVREITWVRDLMKQLKFGHLITDPTLIWCDSQAAITHANNYVDKSRTSPSSTISSVRKSRTSVTVTTNSLSDHHFTNISPCQIPGQGCTNLPIFKPKLRNSQSPQSTKKQLEEIFDNLDPDSLPDPI